MIIQHLRGYKFIALEELEILRDDLLSQCQSLSLKGTILISSEGININLSGEKSAIIIFQTHLQKDHRFTDIPLRIMACNFKPYQRMKVKIKKEIITLRHATINLLQNRAPSISPNTLKNWLDKNDEMLLLDTRNEYEIKFGTFSHAINLHLKNFCEFPDAIKKITHEKKIVMFCTGGIRCEKAALYMLEQGYKEVYQLEGGILNYFSQIGNTHYNGECYVFDERVSVK